MSEHAEHAHPNYWKIYWILLVLLAVSIIGPEIGRQVDLPALTLFTAFGIAIVKAYLVAKNFMHVNVEPKFVTYMLTTCLVFMLLFFAAVAPDVMKDVGSNWTKPAWLEQERAYNAGEIGEAAHGEEADSHNGGH